MAILRASVQVLGSFTGAPGANVWHFRTTGTPNTEPDVLMGYIRTFYDAVKGTLAAGVTIRFPTEATVLDTPPTFFPLAALTDVAATGSGSLPPQDAIVVGWKTSNATRRGRGRTFLGPLASTGATDSDGSPVAARITTIQNAANALVTSSTSFGNGAIGVYSQLDNQLRDVTSARVRDVYAVLRSRRD